MAATKFISGSYVTLVGSFQDVTGSLGYIEKVPAHKLVAFAVSGSQVIAVYNIGSRGFNR